MKIKNIWIDNYFIEVKIKEVAVKNKKKTVKAFAKIITKG